MTAPTEQPATVEGLMGEPSYYAHRLERSLEDFPDDPYPGLDRGFLRDCAVILRAYARLAAPPNTRDADLTAEDRKYLTGGLIEALRSYRQIDEDGTDCGVSREAVEVAANILEKLVKSQQTDADLTSSVPGGTVMAAGWQPFATAPKDGTPFLAWYPKLQLDEDDEPTDEVVGGAVALIAQQGDSLDEPDWVGAHGAYFFEDWCFAEVPTHWMPEPEGPQGGK